MNWDVRSTDNDLPSYAVVASITEGLKIAYMEDGPNMQSSPHVMDVHLPLVAEISNGLFVEYIPSLDPVLTEPLKLKAGYFHVSDIPGLGININCQKLKQYEGM